MLRGGKLSVMPVKHRKAAVARAQAEHPTPGMADYAGRLVHHLLQHRSDTPALGRMAHGRIGLVQGVLSNQAQQVHCHGSKPADQVIGVKLAAGQALQVHIGLELGVKLLVRGVVGVQRHDLGRAEPPGQRRGPALQHVLGQQQSIAVLVDRALGKPVNAPGRIRRVADIDQIKRVLPDAFALARAQRLPGNARIARLVRGNRLNRDLARVSLDD